MATCQEMDDQDERALAGLLFDTAWSGYRDLKARTHDLCRRYNTLDELDPERAALLPRIFAEIGEGAHIRGPLQVNCGSHTRIGARFFANFHLTLLDDVAVTIGDDVQLGPGVTIIAGTHPLLLDERRHLTYPDGHTGGAEYADPVVIDDGAWLGANVTVLPGVRIGERAVIGAGSLVTRDVPAGWLAVGVPARPVREITAADSVLHRLGPGPTAQDRVDRLDDVTGSRPAESECPVGHHGERHGERHGEEHGTAAASAPAVSPSGESRRPAGTDGH